MTDTATSNIQELLARPRETLDVEIKSWLDLGDHNQRADLAKAILAVANHGGGFVVVGLEENAAGQFAPAPERPTNLSGLAQDDIQNAIQKYLEPSIQCRVYHVEHPEGHGTFPIVVVPGGHRVPIKAKVGSPDGKLVAGRVYVRRPGPKSEVPQTSAEWDQLFERCIRARRDELLDGIRDLLAGQVPEVEQVKQTTVDQLATFTKQAEKRWAERVKGLDTDASPRFPHGFYAVGIALEGDFPKQSAANFRRTLEHAVRDHSGWPPFLVMGREVYRPILIEDAVEAWFGPDENSNVSGPADSDFWRASPIGLFYIRRGLDEDGRYRGMEPGTSFDITTPTRRFGEILLQVHYIARAMAAGEATARIRAEWSGLSGRQLVSVGNPRRYLTGSYRAHQKTYDVTTTTSVAALNDALPEVVFGMLEPLYMLFDFYQLPKRLVEQELQDLRRNQF